MEKENDETNDRIRDNITVREGRKGGRERRTEGRKGKDESKGERRMQKKSGRTGRETK